MCVGIDLAMQGKQNKIMSLSNVLLTRVALDDLFLRGCLPARLLLHFSLSPLGGARCLPKDLSRHRTNELGK